MTSLDQLYLRLHTMELLHIYSDGSTLFRMSAFALTRIPIWKGNRIIDPSHINTIKQSIQGNVHLLDSGYKIIQYDEYDETNMPCRKAYIIDGQHRLRILTSHFATSSPEDSPDFEVTVTEIHVSSEDEAIDYFNKINNVKPIVFEEDPALIVNKYIYTLMAKYSSKKALFRQGTTKRPYVSIDKLRDALLKRVHSLKKIPLDTFANACITMNDTMIRDLEIRSLNPADKDMRLMIRCLDLKFALAWDDKFKWLDAIIQFHRPTALQTHVT